MCEYSIIIKCETYERFKEILSNMDEIAKKREGVKKNDNRTIYMKELHRRTKEFHEAHSIIPYKECLSIIAEEMKEEKEQQEVIDLVAESVIDLSNGDVPVV